jgi:alpha-maltose-1-phosphate synthase
LIISNVGGNREAIVAGENGCLIPPRDTAAFMNATLELMHDPARARAMGEAGTRRAQQEFSLQTMAARVATVYRALVTTGRT